MIVESSLFCGGFLLGITLIWGLIVLHGHQGLYFQGIQEAIGLAVDSKSHHPGVGLLKRLIKEHVLAFSDGLLFVVVLGWLANWATNQKRPLASLGVLVGSILLFYFNYFRGCWRWGVPGVCYIVLLLIVLHKFKKENSLTILACIAGMVLFLVPLGSGNGIANSVFGMWLALPFTLTWLWQSADRILHLLYKTRDNGFETNRKFSMGPSGFRYFTFILFFALLFQTGASAWRYTYSDNINRFAMRRSIPHPLLAGIYTTAERAKIVTELLDAMSRFAKPGDEVLAYNGISTVYFLTETHPWLGSASPDYDIPEKLAARIRARELNCSILPCVVRATGSTYTPSWPIGAAQMITWNRQDESRHIIAEYLLRNGYSVVWENEFFEILTPGK